MRHTPLIVGVAFGAAMVAALPASAAVTFVSAALTATTTAASNAKSHTTTADSLPTNSLNETLGSLAGPNEASVIASASFDGATSAVVEYDKLFARGSGVGLGPTSAAGVGEATASFTYDFTVDGSYFAQFAYDTAVGSGAKFSYVIYPTGQYSGANAGNIPDGAGYLFSDPFGPGAYTLTIYAAAKAISYPGQATVSQTTAGSIGLLLVPNGRINSPTPEPATWAMMLMGFGAMGAALRRRQGPAAA